MKNEAKIKELIESNRKCRQINLIKYYLVENQEIDFIEQKA